MKKNTYLTILLFCLTILFYQQAFSQPQWPAIKQENKPWTRWWWEGSIGTKADLSAAMEKYRKAGLGGMELTVIYGVKGKEKEFTNYLSPEWMDKFRHILKEGKRLDLGVDLANASGWPFGGPWVESEDACKNINFKTYTLKTGETLSEPVTFTQAPMLRATGKKPAFSDLVDPVGKSKNLQIYALDQVRFEKKLPLYILMAYSDAGGVLNLTDKVDTAGKLNWTAPEGNWTLYALFPGWHGKMVERAGPGGEGDVIDHFSEKAVDRYLSYFDKAFKGSDLSGLRGYFNDSYEVDDAQGQANWTPELISEFKARRGYDLTAHFPALFQKDTPENNAKVLCDYRQTISELLLEKYTIGWADWAHKQGKIIRNQSHGSPANILDLYAATDIPETEGNEVLRFKFASSAANVTGKKLVSSESATWLNEHFLSSLGDVKQAIDKYFVGGVNHIFYHGTCFTPQNELWPGFLFYASVEFTPANSFWNDFPALNNYIARVQSFLQNAKSTNDILLYFPIYDSYSENGRVMLEHFDGIGRGYRGQGLIKCATNMQEKGYAFDFISDLQLQHVLNSGYKLKTGGAEYQTVMVPSCKFIPLETFEKVMSLARSGATVIFQGKLPEDVPGYGNLENRRKAFQQLKDELTFTAVDTLGNKQAILGKGKILLGEDPSNLLNIAKIRRETMTDSGLEYNRRTTDKGNVYFIVNTTNKTFEGWLPLQTNASSAAIYDAMTTDLGMAGTRKTADGIEIFANLKPGQSLMAETYNQEVKGNSFPYYLLSGDPKLIEGEWNIKFLEGGPALPAEKKITNLITWTDLGGDDVKNFSGTASYTIHFSLPKEKADAWMLNLGKVCESARVILNGKELGILIGPEFQIRIDSKLLKPENTLEIKVSNLMANRIAYLDRNGVEWKKFYNVNLAARLSENRNSQGIFDASKWQPRTSGLLGPVTLTPAVLQK